MGMLGQSKVAFTLECCSGGGINPEVDGFVGRSLERRPQKTLGWVLAQVLWSPGVGRDPARWPFLAVGEFAWSTPCCHRHICEWFLPPGSIVLLPGCVGYSTFLIRNNGIDTYLESGRAEFMSGPTTSLALGKILYVFEPPVSS